MGDGESQFFDTVSAIFFKCVSSSSKIYYSKIYISEEQE